MWYKSRKFKRRFAPTQARLSERQLWHYLVPASNRLFQVLDVYWHCPESRGEWCTSRQLKRRFARPQALIPKLTFQHPPALSAESNRLFQIALFKSPFFRTLVSTGAARNPEACITNQGNRKRRFAPHQACLSERQVQHYQLPASNRLIQVLHFYRRCPESGGVWYKSRQFTEAICSPQAHLSECQLRHDFFSASNHLFQVLNFNWRCPESGCVWLKSGQMKKTICSPSGASAGMSASASPDFSIKSPCLGS